MKVLLPGADVATCCAVRRALLEDVESLAIDAVRVDQNDSVVYDEILVQRLGLVPLFAPTGRTSATGYLAVRAAPDEMGVVDVTSDRIRWDHGAPSMAAPDIVLTQLAAGEAVSCLIKATRGRGRDHSKWCPVTVVRILDEGVDVEAVDDRESPRHLVAEALRILEGRIRRLADDLSKSVTP